MVRFQDYRERNINQILARRLLCDKIEMRLQGSHSVLSVQQMKIRKQKKRRERRQEQ